MKIKNSIIGLICLLAATLPFGTAAQNNIKTAFDDIIKCPDAQVTEVHQLDKNPSDALKTGQCDIYRFVLPESKANLIDQAVSAFDKDAEKAYSVNRGKAQTNDRELWLSIGDGQEDGSSVWVNKPGYDYIYSLYLAPLSEDPLGNYRYAYAMNYCENEGMIYGELIVTYATTLKYRQEIKQKRRDEVLNGFSDGSYALNKLEPEPESWVDMVMSYIQGIPVSSSRTRIQLASKAYMTIRTTSEYPDVTEVEKDIIREVLKAMLSDDDYSETVLNKLLTQCLEALK